jgi:alkanesulfonate monooxygenase SsuD/methylene tetrahydromethanopterin reductase-like flavin-dependent oxidoreductase (luciferase family)
MRFSVWPNLAQPWNDVVAVATHAEATGWDGVYVADHFMGDNERAGGTISPTFEATAAMAGLAVATDRVRLGSLVFGITYRHPAVLANWAKTVDHMSGGRLLLGVGAGWQINEHEQYGIELGRPGVRIDRFEESLQVLNGLLREPVTNVAGEHYRLTDAVMEPKPVQSPLPILIGGKGDRMMRVVARHADEWNMWSSPAEFAERSQVLDAACADLGRDPATIARSTQALFFIGDDTAKIDALIERVKPRPAVGGPADRLIEAVQGWADVGVDEVIVPDFTLGSGAQRLEALDLVVEQVAPQFR